MGSYASTTTKDNKLGIEGDIGQVTAPESQIANPFGLAIGASDRGRVNLEMTTGNILYNDLVPINALVTSIMAQNNQALESIGELNRDINAENSLNLAAMMKNNNTVLDRISGTVTQAASSFGNLGGNILESISTTANEIKEPLTKYVPIAVLLIIVFVFYKTGKS